MIEAKLEEINEFKGINALKFGAKFGKLTMVSLEIPKFIDKFARKARI